MLRNLTRMFRVIFTLDYELHGNGDGCPRELMVEPTERLLALLESYGAKLTIMADIAEILKFKEYRERFGRDDYHYEPVTAQLREAIRRGHDVQLHIHASYFNARHERGRWIQDWSEYNFAGLGLPRLREVVRTGKQFLESLLQPVDRHYVCNVFRAANWSMNPSNNAIRALVENGIKVDTSVFKYGQRSGLVNFDYTNTPSDLIPWKADENDICVANAAGRLLEFPIYSENRWVGAFLTPQRLHRAYQTWRHKFTRGDEGPIRGIALPNSSRNKAGSRGRFGRHAWKADFNQCRGRQLIGALKRAEARHGAADAPLPFVLIGHSKLFTRFNAWSLGPFLRFVAAHPGRFGFGKFSDFSEVRDLDTPAARPVAAFA